jgi:prepilin-type N-terminal cleavage/methylation domain-containing protein
MKQTPQSRQGMSLIEVLVAMLILSIAASALLLAMSQCLAVVRTARSREIARGLILRVDMDYPIESVDMDELSESGTFDEKEGYVWFREIQIVDEEERPGLFLVTTRVQWAERGRDAFEEITTYRYAPDAEVITSDI